MTTGPRHRSENDNRSAAPIWVRGTDLRGTDLEKENERLKRVVADLALDNRMLKDLAEGNF